jgi:hypothetical protein
MTDITTSLLMISPTGVGPFHSPDWRVGFTAQLVEGSGNGPYWLYQDAQGCERVLMIDSLHPEIVACSVVLLVSVLAGNAEVLSILDATHNITHEESGGIRIAPYWDLADEVTKQLVTHLAPMTRLGLVTLDANSIASSAVFAHLLEFGMVADSFYLQASTA